MLGGLDFIFSTFSRHACLDSAHTSSMNEATSTLCKMT